MPDQASRTRFLAIDLLRTLAIVLMVTYHAAYDLAIFYQWKIDVFHGGWRLIALAAVTLFLLLVGVSFVISSQNRTPSRIWQRSRQRGLIVLGWAMVITIVTYVHNPDTFIRFGVLHCIGVSLLLLPLFHHLSWENAFLFGLLTISAGLAASHSYAPTNWLLPFGITTRTYLSVDYYPLLPWFGMVILGLGIGNIFIRHQHVFHTYNVHNTGYGTLTWPGRHALLVYLVHQPIILGVLYVLSFLYAG